MAAMRASARDDREPFITADGSTIRELAGPAWSAVKRQSLARGHPRPRRGDGRAFSSSH